MGFVAVVAVIFILGLSGREPSRGIYLAVAGAAFAASIWQFFS